MKRPSLVATGLRICGLLMAPLAFAALSSALPRPMRHRRISMPIPA